MPLSAWEGPSVPLRANVAALEGKGGRRPTISWGFLTPDAVLERLAEGGARKDADALKVDVDSFDAELVERVLEGGYIPPQGHQ